MQLVTVTVICMLLIKIYVFKRIFEKFGNEN